MRRSFSFAIAVAALLHSVVIAQSPHGGATAKPQPGANVNAAAGIVDPNDPNARVKSDILLQRQSETVIAGSTRNADHILGAANDFRFVDFNNDPFFGEGSQGFFARLIAKIFRRPSRVSTRAAGNVGGWVGVYRSCDRGATWLGSAVPGSPLDSSPASVGAPPSGQSPGLPPSPLKIFSNAAPVGSHAETTDPVLVAGPGGRMHLVVLGFYRWDDGHISDSRMYYVSYTDLNNLSGGSCFKYDFTVEFDRGTAYTTAKSPAPFIDKPSIAVDKDGTLFASYTLFTDNVNSKIVIARSTNGGQNWTKTSPLISLGFLRNHGTAMTIDQVNGVVYVAWRLFYQNWPLMVVSKSYDRGRTFFPATPISHWWPGKGLDHIVQQLKAAKLQPFDQFTNAIGDPPQARSLAFPTIVAGVVNGQSKLFAAWQERADVTPGSPTFGLPDANGSPRIMLSMSSDGGWSWTPRRAVDAGWRDDNSVQTGGARASGPQLQPVLSISGTTNPQLLLFYYEAREELTGPFQSSFVSGVDRVQDVRIARINPVNGALIASTQVSQYNVKTNSDPVALADTAPGFPAVSRGNLPIYGGGRLASFGDYPMSAPATPFEYSGGAWRWATQPSSTLTMWADHRELQFPKVTIGNVSFPDLYNGDWTAYSPVKPLAPVDCNFVALRNANPYFAEIGGVVAGSPQTFKRLNIQRAFVTYVANRTPDDRFFRLRLLPSTGIHASFDQFTGDVTTATTQIFANSSHTRTVWVEPNLARQTASVRMVVEEVDANGQLVPDGHRTSLTLNPDPNNDALTPVPTQVPVPPGKSQSIDVTELHTPQVSAPQVSAFRISAPQVSAPQVSAPQVSAPQVSAPQVSAPQVSAPQVSAPQVSAPQVSAVAPGEPPNGTDVTYTVINAGNTDTAYNAVFNVPDAAAMLNSDSYDFQVLVVSTSLAPGFLETAAGCVPAAETKVHVIANLQVPQVSAPQISAIQSPQVSAPQVSAIATFSVGAEGGASVVASADAQSTALRPEVKVVLRAIRLRSLADIIADGLPVFNPATVVFNVTSASTNVINGVPDPPGAQPVVVTEAANLQAELAIANYIPSPTPLTAVAGSAVNLSPWRHVNLGAATPAADGGNISNGFYLSIDPIITAEDTRLGGNSNPNAALPPGGWFNWGGPTVTIPLGTAAGSYYIGILVDESDDVDESNELNNYVSEPILITAAFAAGCIPPPANLVAWWAGDGNVKDIQGGFDGSDGSEGGVSFESGKAGPAFTLDGTEAFVTIQANEALRPAQLTVDFWFKSDRVLNGSLDEEVPLVVNLDYSDDSSSVVKGYDFVYAFGNLRFGLGNSDGFRIVSQYATSIAEGEWHHVTGTFDGTLQKLYVDGVLRRTVDWATPTAADYADNRGASAGPWTQVYVPATIMIGRSRSSAFGGGITRDYYFAGQIDEVQLFDRALTGSEIQDLYDATGQCRPIILVASTATSEPQALEVLAVFGEPLTLTATLVPAPPEGSTVEFLDGDTVLATVPVNAGGIATFTTSTLSFAPHSLMARSADTPARAQPSAVLVQHLVRRFDSLAAFNAAIGGEPTGTQDFNTLAIGTSFKNPTTTLIAGVLDIVSAFSYSTTDRFEVYDAGYPGAEKVLFGYSASESFNPRTYAAGGFAYYYAFFAYPTAYHAMAFDIVGQDPTSTPATVSVFAGYGTADFPVLGGSATSNTFIGVMTTKPMDGVYMREGCVAGSAPCVNSPVKLDNFRIR